MNASEVCSYPHAQSDGELSSLLTQHSHAVDALGIVWEGGCIWATIKEGRVPFRVHFWLSVLIDCLLLFALQFWKIRRNVAAIEEANEKRKTFDQEYVVSRLGRCVVSGLDGSFADHGSCRDVGLVSMRSKVGVDCAHAQKCGVRLGDGGTSEVTH